jgi:hypothetical protein
MRIEFVTALHEAEAQDTADARVERIKRAVTNEVRAADPAVSVRFTEYFNNVVVPDMVLRWPEESRERLLFVRPSANPVWLEDDVATLASHRPMIFTLEDIDADGALLETKPFGRLTEHASSADTWIAGPSAIQGVAEARSNSPVIGLLGQALVRGGKGVSTGPSVRALTATTERALGSRRTTRASLLHKALHPLSTALMLSKPVGSPEFFGRSGRDTVAWGLRFQPCRRGGL